MPLKLFKRNEIYWFRGRIEELPSSKYYRQSTGKSSETSARAVLNHFQQREMRLFYSDEDVSLTFADAVLHYKTSPEFAKALIPIVKEIGHLEVSKITPKQVRNLGCKLQPNNATNTWQKRIVSPVRAVINNAHDLGMCSPIRIKAYTDAEWLKQDKWRGKKSRVEKKAGSWPWILAFREDAPPHLAALALFMFETGARISQAVAISFDDLRIVKGSVLMPEAKGIKAQMVRLTPQLYAELEKLEPRYTRRNNGQMILSDKIFGYLRRDSVYKTWKRVCDKAEIDIIMPHAAGRHGFGTEMMVKQGLDAVTVAKVGRWADPQMLFKTYAHPDGAEDKVQEAIRTSRVQAESELESNRLKGKKNDPEES